MVVSNKGTSWLIRVRRMSWFVIFKAITGENSTPSLLPFPHSLGFDVRHLLSGVIFLALTFSSCPQVRFQSHNMKTTPTVGSRTVAYHTLLLESLVSRSGYKSFSCIGNPTASTYVILFFVLFYTCKSCTKFTIRRPLSFELNI